MVDREKVKALIKLHEGLRLKPYKCPAGYLTIGYGRNLEAKGISPMEADMLLESDLDDAIRDAREFFPAFDSLLAPRQAVLVDMAFNLGLPKLRKFKKFRQALVRGDWQDAAREMLDSKWALQVGSRAARLAKMMRTGRWADDVRAH